MTHVIIFIDFLIEFYDALICETKNKRFFLDEILVKLSIVDDYMTSLLEEWNMNWSRICKMTKTCIVNDRIRLQEIEIKRTKNANIVTNKRIMNESKNVELFWNYWCRISWLIEDACMRKTILTDLLIITNTVSTFYWF